MSAPRSLVDLLGETRARILTLIQRSPATAGELAETLGISAAAVRRHLSGLGSDDLVVGRAEPDGSMGRPRERWTLTGRGRRLFTDRSAEFADELMEHLEATFGRTAVLDFLRARSQNQADRYAERIGDTDDLTHRVHELAAALSADGFMARVEQGWDQQDPDRQRSDGSRPDGDPGRTLQLVQSHCAIEGIAAEHPEVCAHEAALFKRLLGTSGQQVKISRRTTIASGANACVCHIELPASPPPRQSATTQATTPTTQPATSTSNRSS